MDTLVWITAVYIVLTKCLDCLTTVRFVRTAEVETNAFASCLMRRFGFVRAVWGIFAFASLWAIALAACAAGSVSASAAWGYTLLGSFVGTVQAAVAVTNATGRLNIITRLVYKVHLRS
jgi:hypothetical protein